MKQWEYKTVFLPVPLADHFQEYLNEMGRDGWEIVGCSFVDGTNQKTYQTFAGIPLRRKTPRPFNIFFLAKREREPTL